LRITFLINTLLFDGDPAQIFLLEFFRYAVLDTCIVGLVFIAQAIDVKDVIPQEVLMFDVYVEVFVLFICLGARHSADETHVLHVFNDLFLSITQLGKCIDHNARYDIAE
jgi:hypothetical protein